DVEYPRPRRNDHHRGILDGVFDDGRHVRRRIDEYPFDAVALGGADDPADGIDGGFDRRLVGAAQLVPQGPRPLRIGINKQTGLRCLMDMGSEMGSQGTLSRATLTRCENNDIHTLASRLTPGAENESAR